MTLRSTYISLAVAALISGASGFAPLAPKVIPSRVVVSPTALNSDATGWDSFEKLKSNLPSGEGQRKFRRTVYTHDDWRKHRNQDRFLYYLLAIFKSGVYKNLFREVALTSTVASFVVVYNMLAGGYTDLGGVAHGPVIPGGFLPTLGLPLAAFTLTSPSLGLLLGAYLEIRTCVYLFYFYCNDWIAHMCNIILCHPSFPYEHLLPTLGRSAKELGIEHQPHP